MKNILVICKKDNEMDGINGELNEEGYTVQKIDIDSVDLAENGFNAYDLAIISLHPDVPEAWRLYREFKKRYPDLPVLVCMNPHPLTSLKAAIRDALQPKPSRLSFSAKNDANRQNRRL